MTDTRIIQNDNWTIRADTPDAAIGAPRSDGRPFPKDNHTNLPDAKFEAGRALISDLLVAQAFRINPGLRAREEHRVWGPYPDEGTPIPVDAALENLKGSLVDALAALNNDNRDLSVEHLEASLEALRSLSIHNDGEELVAPLYTMLPNDLRIEFLSRLAFAYAELVDDEDGQRRVQRYLDLLLGELPDPLADEVTTERQRFIRMFAHIYMGRSLDRSRTIQEAIAQLETALEINDIHQAGIEQPRVEAHAALIGLLVKRAHKLRSEKKFIRADEHVDRAIALRKQLEQRLGSGAEQYRDRLIEISGQLALELWCFGRVEEAYEELYDIQSRHGSDVGFRLFNDVIKASNFSPRKKAHLISRFTSKAKKLEAPGKVKPKALPARAVDWVSLSVLNARRKGTLDTAVGWLIGAGAGATAIYLAKKGQATGAEYLVGTSTTATIVDVLRRMLNGATSPQTKSAMRLGLNPNSALNITKGALAFSANTLIPWALFGGALPLAGAASDVPILGALINAAPDSAIASGSITGPGTLVANTISSVGHAVSNLIDPSSASEAAGNLSGATSGWEKSTFGSTLGSGYGHYFDVLKGWFNTAINADSAAWALGSFEAASVGSLLAYKRFEAFKNLVDNNPVLSKMKPIAALGTAGAGYHLATAINTNPLYATDGVDLAIKTFSASSLAYLLGYRLSDKFQKAVNEKAYLRKLGPAALLGGLLGGANLGVALGAPAGNVDFGVATLPLNSIGNAATGMFFSALGQTLIGNRRLRDLQYGHMLGAAYIINVYIGLSNNAVPAHRSEGLEVIAESAARQLVMAPAILLHGALQRVDWRRYGENKLSRFLVTDHAGNGIRIMANGWGDAGPVALGTTASFAINLVLGRMFNECAGTKIAQSSFESLLRNAKGVAAEGDLKAFARALRRIPASAPITKLSKDTLLLPYHVIMRGRRGERLAPYMRPEEKSYRMLHEMLMSEDITPTQVQTVLSATEQFLERPDDADLARGLMRILAASQTGHHGQQIRRFVREHRDVRTRLRLELDPERAKLPEDRRAKERAIWTELQHPYRVAPSEESYLPEESSPMVQPDGTPLISAPLMGYMRAGMAPTGVVG